MSFIYFVVSDNADEYYIGVCHVNYFRGKSNPDVILIGKMDTSLSKKKKRESLGEKVKGTEYFEDSEDSICRKDKSMYKLNRRFQFIIGSYNIWFNSLVTCTVLNQVKLQYMAEFTRL